MNLDWRKVLEESPFYFFVVVDGKISDVNLFTQQRLGYSKEELVGREFIDLIGSEHEKILEIIKKPYFREKETLRFKLYDVKNQVIEIEGTFLIFSLDKKAVIIIGKDLREVLELRKRIESFYRQQSFVEFLRSLIHDFNNILQVSSNYLKKIKENADNSSEVKRYSMLAEKTLASWIDLNKILLEYTKEIRELKQAQTELVSFLKNNLEIFQVIAGSEISIRLNFGNIKKVLIPGEETFWRYIFLNFISNAKDAIQGEGYIDIFLSVTREKGNKYLVVFISDTGCGIPEEIIDKIFLPFFTTKKQGSGLGLFLVKNHIESLGGKIEVESQVKKGTTFKIYVPILSLVLTKPLEPKIQLNILLLEDDDEQRQNLKDILEKEGYQIFAFKSFKELEENLEKISHLDLLIVDYHLPEFSGEEIYKKLKEKFPHLEVLYLTGDIFKLAELPIKNVLIKPFSVEQLLCKVKELMI